MITDNLRIKLMKHSNHTCTVSSFCIAKFGIFVNDSQCCLAQLLPVFTCTSNLLYLNGYLPAALRAAQTCQYLIYSQADFEVFRPAGATRCTDGGEIWHGGCQISPHRCNDKGVGPQKRQKTAKIGGFFAATGR